MGWAGRYCTSASDSEWDVEGGLHYHDTLYQEEDDKEESGVLAALRKCGEIARLKGLTADMPEFQRVLLQKLMIVSLQLRSRERKGSDGGEASHGGGCVKSACISRGSFLTLVPYIIGCDLRYSACLIQLVIRKHQPHADKLPDAFQIHIQTLPQKVGTRAMLKKMKRRAWASFGAEHVRCSCCAARGCAGKTRERASRPIKM